MSKNICFVSNFHLTDFYQEIARKLFKRGGFNIYWLCTNKKYLEILQMEWGNDNVLPIGFSDVENYTLDDSIIPGDIVTIKTNDLLIRDRILKFNIEKGSKYLENLKKVSYHFLETNQIDCIFGELTWSHEVVINRVCRHYKKLKAVYFNPHTLRLPQKTFGFFLDEYQSTLICHKTEEQITKSMISRYELIFSKCDVDIPKPEYLKLNDTLLKNNNKLRNKVTKFYKLIFQSVDVNDPTLERNKIRRVTQGLKQALNTIHYQRMKKSSLEDIENLSFFIYPLHKQPEASIDIIGKYYDDQMTNIRNITSQLSENEYLVVKEHSNAIGDRNLSFYNNVTQLPRVILIDEKIDMNTLIDKCIGLYTVSGTAALEAALKGITAFCFSDVYFRDLKSCNVVTLENLSWGHPNYKQYNSSHSLSNDDFSKKMLLSACDGIISNPVSDPRCISPENIEKVSGEFYSLIQSI